MPIAQINVARMRAPLDTDTMKEFRDFIAPINMLAESSSGFIWRFREEDYPDLPPHEDEMLAINMSVWADLEELQEFTFKTVHSYFIRSRKKWFHQLGHPHVVLWWVEEGHIPSLADGFERLRIFEEQGPTDKAFLFAQAETFRP